MPCKMWSRPTRQPVFYGAGGFGSAGAGVLEGMPEPVEDDGAGGVITRAVEISSPPKPPNNTD